MKKSRVAMILTMLVVLGTLAGCGHRRNSCGCSGSPAMPPGPTTSFAAPPATLPCENCGQ
ncbi:hypothetical protein [Tuwongella immobilis]|uniref:Lipoprotein n=1 Tax=Tuwongella immobilis TaxID=692036 RepID=A0A6C2YK71_9BACT|nr:hypothetical protein [Tuwongella immobilis]VIP01980.1 unnamed protein product [Tuwongella immobilis]VTS00027.1 unnamed protein product [Tuwongella immobilis]